MSLRRVVKLYIDTYATLIFDKALKRFASLDKCDTADELLLRAPSFIAC